MRASSNRLNVRASVDKLRRNSKSPQSLPPLGLVPPMPRLIPNGPEVPVELIEKRDAGEMVFLRCRAFRSYRPAEL